MSIIFELAVVVVVVWAALQGWGYWQRHHPLPPSIPPNAQFPEQLKSLSKTSLDYLRGRRGRKGQILTVALVVGLICVVGLTRSVLVGLIAVGVIAIWSHLRRPPVMEGPTAVVPPPLPPQARRPMPPAMGMVSEPPKRRRGFLSWFVWLILGLMAAGLYWEFDNVRDEVHVHLPQVAGWFDRTYEARLELSRRHAMALRIDQEAEARSIEARSAAIEAKGASIEEKAEKLSQNAEEMAERIVDNVEKYVDATTQKIEEKMEGALVSPSGGNPEKQEKESPAPLTLGSPVRFSAMGATEHEAQRALLTKVGEHLSTLAIRSGRPVEMASWVPSAGWTQKYFARDIKYKPMPSQTPGVNLFVAEVDVPALNEKKIEQVFGEFRSDKMASRSLGLLKGFAGTVLVLGGISVFLRLGTGRQFAPPTVSSKKGWFGAGKRQA
jgi:hypothetical protein